MTSTIEPLLPMERASHMIHATQWLQGEPPAEITLSETSSADGVVSFSVAYGADPVEVFEALRPRCDGLTLELIQDVLDPDDLPKVLKGEEKCVRAVSAFGARAFRDAGHEGRAGMLVFDVVETIAGRDWLVVCCHEAQSYAGSDRVDPRRGANCAALFSAIEERWVEHGLSSAGDLGVLLLHQLACSYRDSRKWLERWLEEWELDFYKENRCDEQAVIALRGLAAEFRHRLSALSVPRDEAHSSWFTGVTDIDLAQKADYLIDKSIADLERLNDMLRTAFELLQLKLGQEQQKQAEWNQRRFERVGAIFLVPTLVAAFFGANTALPGGNGTESWAAFELMMFLMVVGTVTALVLLGGTRFASKRWAERGSR